MTLKAVFFDLDGTLLDTAPDLAKALNRLLIEENLSPLPEPRIRQVVSDGAYALLKLGFNVDRDHEHTPALRARLLDFYLEDIASGTTAFSGIEGLIETLASNDITWGIVTNKPEAYATPLMKEFNFASEPACLICPDHVEKRKPHEEPLLLACEYAKCKPQEAIYIGDHLRDIECGKNAKMPTIAANYGYINDGDSAHNWKADYVVENGEDIWPLIKNSFL